MRLLYVFPHPDDESFGPAAAIARQRRDGHEVRLLTLTRGGATKRRHELGLSVEEMGAVRELEMRRMAEALGLDGLEVLDLPDSGLAELDPRVIEGVVDEAIERLAPDVVVSYPVHGISGFADHLVTHAVVKRVVCDRWARQDAAGEPRVPRRLAFVTLAEAPDDGRRIPLTASKPEAIDVVEAVSDADLDRQRAALACYATYAAVIDELDPMSVHGREIVFEVFGEVHDPPLSWVGAGLDEAREE